MPSTETPEIDRFRLVLDEVTERFVRGVDAPETATFHLLPPPDARRELLRLQSGPAQPTATHTEDLILPTGPTGAITVRMIRPMEMPPEGPLLIFYHGGGWMMGDRATHERLARDIAIGANAAVVIIDYDLSPETQFPVPLQQAYSALCYFARHGSDLGVDPSRIAVMGDCAGGNLATATTLMAKANGGPRVRFQILLYPTVDSSFNTTSYTQFAHGPWLTAQAMRRFWDCYLPNPSERGNILAAPLRASVAELSGLPDALVIVSEYDVLRDEGEAYARKLAEAGVRVTSFRSNATIHDFAMLNALAETPAAKAATALIVSALKSVFH